MAVQMQLGPYATGRNVYATIQRQTDNAFWRTDTLVFEAFNATNWASYATSLTEVGTIGLYAAAFPSQIGTTVLYRVAYWERAGGTPATTDTGLADELLDPTGLSSTTASLYGSSGAITFTYTVYDTDGTTPLPGTAVYVSSDVAGTNRSDTQMSDTLGRTTWHLDAGTVYFWRSHANRTFTNPDTETVS